MCPGQRSEPGLRGGRASPGWSPCWALVSPSIRAGGDGVTGPKAGRSLGTHPLCSLCPWRGGRVHLSAGSLGVAMCAPRAGPQGGPGAGVLGSQPTGAEPGSRWGRELGAARGPEPGSSAARTCPAGLPLPEEGAVCWRGSRGLGMSPGGRAWGCPLRGPGGGAVLASLPAPTPPAFRGHSAPGGCTLGLGLKSHWTSLPVPADWLAAAALLRKDVGSERLGVQLRVPRSPWWGWACPSGALPAPSCPPTLPPQAQTP